MKTSEELLASATRCSYCRRDLLELGAELPPDDDELDRLLEAAVERHEPHGLANLMVAALAAERRVDARHLAKGAREIDDIGIMIAIAGHCSGDLAAAMLAATQSGHMSWERETLALLVAAWHCRESGRTQPDGLITETRVLARRVSTFEARHLLLAAAHVLDDDSVWEILDPEHSREVRLVGEQVAQSMIHDLQRPVLFAVPELPPPTILQGYTVKRAIDRVGRNDPCPCGSGKKYKRCCQEKDEERLRDSSDIAGVTRQEQRDDPESFLTARRLWEMPPHEVVALDPARIPPNLHGSYLNRLNIFDEFEAVLAFLEATGIHDGYEEHILDTIEHAVRKQKLSVARRLVAFVPDYEDPGKQVSLTYRFVRDGLEIGPALELIEEEALKILDDEVQTDFVCELIDIGCPALGILAGRGAIARMSLWEVETVLDHMLEARDRLDLSPGDPGEELYDERLLRYTSASEDEVEDAQDLTEYHHFQEANARVQALEKQLAEKDQVLDRMQRRRQQQKPKEQLATEGSEVVDTSPPPAPDPDLAALRTERAALKAEVKLNHQERNRYRRAFRAAVEERDAIQRENEAIRDRLETNLARVDSAADDAPDLLLEEAVEARHPVRVPAFSERFSEMLAVVPDRIARKTIHLCGRLAAGEEAAFRGAKRLVANREIIRQRIGVYRLLFRLGGNELLALELVHRRDLEQAVFRNTRS